MSYLKPQDQIQDGVVDRSPTENAVYDALAGKADVNLQNLSLSGSNGQVLTLVSGVPAWAALPASGVTSVTASAPLASSGGTTPNISISQASALSNGYLSSTDWSTFNGKQNSLTLGNLTEVTSSVLTISGGSGSVIGTGTSIQVKQASAGQSGFLSSTDWSTFNGKQPAGNYITALTGEVTATGPGSAAATIAGQAGNADKVLVTNGTTVSFQYAGLGSGGFGTNNVFLGRAKPSGLTTGSSLTLAGAQAGDALTTGNNNVYLGYQAGKTPTTGLNGVCIGSLSDGYATNGQNQVAIGYSCKANNGNVAIGANAAADNARNVSIGFSAVTGANSDSIAIGNYARCDGQYSIHIGSYSGTSTLSVGGAISLNGVNSVANSTLLGRSNEIYFNQSTGFIRQFTASLSEQVIYPAFYGTGGTINDAVGALFTIAGSTGTGTGAGGDIRFTTAPASGVSSNTQNARVERMRISSTGDVKVVSGQLTIDTVGKGLTIKAGSNAKIGVATFSGVSSVTVSTTAVTANSIILVTNQSGGYAPMCVNNIVAGTSFDIIHNNTFTGTVGWMIVERS